MCHDVKKQNCPNPFLIPSDHPHGHLLRRVLLRRARATTRHSRRGGERRLAVQDVPPHLDVVVGELAELAVVDADVLVLDVDAQGEAGDEVHEEEDDAGEGEGVAEDGADAGELVAELDPVAVDPADGGEGGAVEVGDGGAGQGRRS